MTLRRTGWCESVGKAVWLPCKSLISCSPDCFPALARKGRSLPALWEERLKSILVQGEESIQVTSGFGSRSTHTPAYQCWQQLKASLRRQPLFVKHRFGSSSYHVSKLLPFCSVWADQSSRTVLTCAHVCVLREMRRTFSHTGIYRLICRCQESHWFKKVHIKTSFCLKHLLFFVLWSLLRPSCPWDQMPNL